MTLIFLWFLLFYLFLVFVGISLGAAGGLLEDPALTLGLLPVLLQLVGVIWTRLRIDGEGPRSGGLCRPKPLDQAATVFAEAKANARRDQNRHYDDED
jgi:hypothetical protein